MTTLKTRVFAFPILVFHTVLASYSVFSSVWFSTIPTLLSYMLAYRFCVYPVLQCLKPEVDSICKTEITWSAVRLKILCNQELKYMNYLSSVCVCIYISFIVQQKKIYKI
jgi:hypothetical protein